MSLLEEEKEQLNHLNGVILRLPKKIEKTGDLSHIKTDPATTLFNGGDCTKEVLAKALKLIRHKSSESFFM